MTTVISPEVFDQTAPTKKRLSDAEILQRVREIKSTWTLAERAERRREADRRFESLIDTIFAEAA
ncbi:MAG: hypothetical protein AAFU85_31765 [Planctomycetota bacterium]